MTTSEYVTWRYQVQARSYRNEFVWTRRKLCSQKLTLASKLVAVNLLETIVIVLIYLLLR